MKRVGGRVRVSNKVWWFFSRTRVTCKDYYYCWLQENGSILVCANVLRPTLWMAISRFLIPANRWESCWPWATKTHFAWSRDSSSFIDEPVSSSDSSPAALALSSFTLVKTILVTMPSSEYICIESISSSQLISSSTVTRWDAFRTIICMKLSSDAMSSASTGGGTGLYRYHMQI